MPHEITCLRCKHVLRVAEGNPSPSLTCPRCLAMAVNPHAVQSAAPPSVPAYRVNEQQLPDVDVRRDSRGTVVFLVALVGLGFVGFLSAVGSFTEQESVICAGFVLFPLLLDGAFRLGARASRAPGADADWTAARALTTCAVVGLLLVPAILIFVFVVCAMNPMQLGK